MEQISNIQYQFTKADDSSTRDAIVSIPGITVDGGHVIYTNTDDGSGQIQVFHQDDGQTIQGLGGDNTIVFLDEGMEVETETEVATVTESGEALNYITEDGSNVQQNIVIQMAPQEHQDVQQPQRIIIPGLENYIVQLDPEDSPSGSKNIHLFQIPEKPQPQPRKLFPKLAVKPQKVTISSTPTVLRPSQQRTQLIMPQVVPTPEVATVPPGETTPQGEMVTIHQHISELMSIDTGSVGQSGDNTEYIYVTRVLSTDKERNERAAVQGNLETLADQVTQGFVTNTQQATGQEDTTGQEITRIQHDVGGETQIVMEESTQQVTETPQPVIPQVMDKTTQQVTEKVSTYVTRKVTHQVTGKTAQQVIGKAKQPMVVKAVQVEGSAMQPVAGKVTQVAGKATQLVAGKVTQVAGKAMQLVAGKVTQQVTGNVTQVAGKVTQQVAGKVTQVAGKATHQVTGKVIQVAGKATQQVSASATQRTLTNPPKKTPQIISVVGASQNIVRKGGNVFQVDPVTKKIIVSSSGGVPNKMIILDDAATPGTSVDDVSPEVDRTPDIETRMKKVHVISSDSGDIIAMTTDGPSPVKEGTGDSTENPEQARPVFQEMEVGKDKVTASDGPTPDQEDVTMQGDAVMLDNEDSDSGKKTDPKPLTYLLLKRETRGKRKGKWKKNPKGKRYKNKWSGFDPAPPPLPATKKRPKKDEEKKPRRARKEKVIKAEGDEDVSSPKSSSKEEEDEEELEDKKCRLCRSLHNAECPLLRRRQKAVINDNVFCGNSSVISLQTLPQEFILSLKGQHGLSVFASIKIEKDTYFGPLVGEKVIFEQMSNKMNFRNLWLIETEETIGAKDKIHVKYDFINTENEMSSNWCRYLRPSLNVEECNVVSFCKDGEIMFVTRENIHDGEELIVYFRFIEELHNELWFDDLFNKTEKLCKRCEVHYTDLVSYVKHVQVFHPYSLKKLKAICRECGLVLESTGELTAHCKEHHQGNGAFVCKDCGKHFPIPRGLQQHRKFFHIIEGDFKCEHCGKSFFNKFKLNNHTRNNHSGKEHRCEICHKLVGSRNALNRHRKSHNPDYRYTCDQCGKHCRDGSNLRTHMRTHTNVKAYPCLVSGCISGFSNKTSLHAHYDRVHMLSDSQIPEKITGVSVDQEEWENTTNEGKSAAELLRSSMTGTQTEIVYELESESDGELYYFD